LIEVLDGMDAITQKKKKEAEEEREKEAQLTLDAEFSLEEFLGLAPKGESKKLYVSKAAKPSQELKKSSTALAILTEKIDLDSEVTDAKFQLKSDVAIGMKETFYICDRTKTGSISRE
jgi:hypothetical protein